MKYLFLTFLLLTGCGSERVYNVPSEEVNIYVQEFINYAKSVNNKYLFYSETIPINIEFVKPEFFTGDQIGRCRPSTRSIYIDVDYWYTSSVASRKVVLFHELGHCWLGQREHREGSLMSAYVMTGKEFASHYKFYMDELFFH